MFFFFCKTITSFKIDWTSILAICNCTFSLLIDQQINRSRLTVTKKKWILLAFLEVNVEELMLKPNRAETHRKLIFAIITHQKYPVDGHHSLTKARNIIPYISIHNSTWNWITVLLNPTEATNPCHRSSWSLINFQVPNTTLCHQ